MALRINNNREALNAHRNLVQNDERLSKSLEKLSSGLKVNAAADGPATLVISEHMRAQISGVNQAIDNNEAAVSLVQTAEGALTEVNRLLIDIRQRAIHAANEGINDDAMLRADQSEIENALDAIDRIAQQTQFGRNRLLDGSRATSGSATDAIVSESGKTVLEFVKASAATKGSLGNGYDVVVTQNSSQAGTSGTLDESQVQSGITLSVRSDGKLATYTSSANDTVKNVIEGLTAVAERAGLNVEIKHSVGIEDTEGSFTIHNQEYGSKHDLQVRSSIANVFQKEDGSATIANEEISFVGEDIHGTINGETGVGDGQLLTGGKSNPNTAGLQVRINEDVELKQVIGNVKVEQNALEFQVGANEGQTVAVAMLDTSSTQMARSVINQSGFSSLADVDVRNGQGAQDTIRLVDRAIDELSSNRGDLGAFQRNTLESNLSSLRIASENLTAAESTLRDADIAKELTEFTKNQILSQTATAQLAQANALPQNVLTLLGSQ
ncbi:MAG: flagellin [SAR324 cluster bacterium]|nr:flagellin [SAR324 cluster bacterium]